MSKEGRYEHWWYDRKEQRKIKKNEQEIVRHDYGLNVFYTHLVRKLCPHHVSEDDLERHRHWTTRPINFSRNGGWHHFDTICLCPTMFPLSRLYNGCSYLRPYSWTKCLKKFSQDLSQEDDNYVCERLSFLYFFNS